MNPAADFCSCTNFKCKLHPTNHNDGCTPCIQKNLKTKEIPTCYFNLLPNVADRKGDSLLDFAKLVLDSEKSAAK